MHHLGEEPAKVHDLARGGGGGDDLGLGRGERHAVLPLRRVANGGVGDLDRVARGRVPHRPVGVGVADEHVRAGDVFS